MTYLPEPTGGDGIREPFDWFCGLISGIRKERGLTQEELGALFHVSQKTIHRWEDGARPPPLLARGILVALHDFAPEYLPAASEALGISLPVTQPDAPLPRPNPAITKAAFEGVLFEASERLGAPSPRVREAIVLVLERMALLGLDVEAAATIAREKRQ